MTIYMQQSSPQKPPVTANSAGPMSIICTGPVIPSVIYHHHMYYLSGSNPSQNQTCCIPYPPTLSHNLTLPHLMNSFVESVIGQQGSILAPRISMPVPSVYATPWMLEPSAVKVNSSNFLNQIDTLDRSKLKESKSSSSVSSCSASSSSYFASLSSPNSSRLSPFSISSPSTPPSSPSSSPSNTSSSAAMSETSASETSKTESDARTNKSSASNTESPTEQNRPPPSAAKVYKPLQQTQQHNYSTFYQPQALTSSSFTPSVLASPLLSSTASAFVPGAFFGPQTGTLPNQATGAFCAPNSQQQQQPHLPVLPLRDYYARFGVHYNPVPWNQSYGMERVWISEFRRIFSAFYNELWSIQPVERKPTGIKLHMFVDAAKVRFCCDKCGHSWTSMKGRIVFWFNLLQPNFNTGIVAIRLFGQKCEMCKLDVYEQPMWYPEEVTKVLMNLFNRVGQIFYGFEKTKFERQRRLGKPRTPHNKYLCQACLEGICLSRLNGNGNGRRACPAAAAHQQACSVQNMTKAENESTEPDQVLLSKQEEGECAEKENLSENAQIRVVHDEDDEGEYSEDSGIVESDADRSECEQVPLKTTSTKVTPVLPAKVIESACISN